MRVVSATSARANLFGLIDQVTDEHEEVMITTKRKNAVLVSEEDWRSMQETLYLTSIPGMVESVQEARKEPREQRVSLEAIRGILNGTDED
jgi:antitoxin YefM